MRAVQYAPPVEVAGHAIVVVSVVTVSGYQKGGVYAFVGEKRPVAIVCRRDEGERILGLDGRNLDVAELDHLAAEAGGC